MLAHQLYELRWELEHVCEEGKRIHKEDGEYTVFRTVMDHSFNIGATSYHYLKWVYENIKNEFSANHPEVYPKVAEKDSPVKQCKIEGAVIC